MADEKDKSKYWIEPGSFVERVIGPKVVITIDEVLKENGFDKHQMPKVFTKGVSGHWITDAGIYQQGTFRTDELRPHINTEQNVKITEPR